jgi:hypothetical protein
VNAEGLEATGSPMRRMRRMRSLQGEMPPRRSGSSLPE